MSAKDWFIVWLAGSFGGGFAVWIIGQIMALFSSFKPAHLGPCVIVTTIFMTGSLATAWAFHALN